MASLDYRLNPMYTIKDCSSCGALYNKSCGCSKGGFVDKFIRDPNKTPYSSQRPPHNCLKCGNPVDGLYCRQCALLRKKLKEVWFTICDENGIFQDFLNTFDSSNDDTNVVNAPQEPLVFNQDPGENSSQSPPRIDHHCCYGCGDSLDGIFCQQCTCESCGNGAHIGYNCPPKVLIISNPEPCPNQNVDDFLQTLPSFHPTCYSGDENSFACDSTPNFVDDSPNIFNPPPQPPTYSYEFCGNDAHYSHDSNVLNAPQEPLVFNQDPGKNSSQSPPHIDHHCCYGCGDLLDGPPETFQCQPMNYYESNLCYEYNYSGFDQSQPPQFPVIHQPPQETSVENLHDHENVINSVQSFLRKFNHFPFLKMPKVLLLAWDRISEIKDAFGNKQYKPKDMQELFCKLFNDVKNIHKELAEYINTPSWNRPTFSNYDDDDEDYTIAITPEIPDNSLSMEDEHHDTIPATESDEVIKSSVEDLVSIPSESEGIPDNMCDVPFRDNSLPLDISKDQFKNFSDSNDDSTSIDDDYFSIESIDYFEASLLDSKLVSLDGEIEDDILHEKLLNINLLIAKIESLNDNPTPDRVLESPSPFPIPVEDSDSFLEKSDTSLLFG
nr:hypothetical protein [Tanacetum cinerariifolium]